MEHYNKSKESSFNFFLPIAFILSIIPLIVRMIFVKIDQTTAKVIGSSVQLDLFSQRKALFLMIFSILLVIISIIFFNKIFSKKDKIITYILIFCGVFFLFTSLSAIFSKYKELSFYGFFDRAEGLITINCYMILFIYSIYSFKSANDYKYIIVPFLILIFVNSFLGVFQYFGQDLINTPLGNYIVIPSEYKIDASQLYWKNNNSIYGTLFNSNYVGSFVSIIFPILFFLTIFEYNVANKIILFIGTGFSIFLLFGSNSRSGFIGIFSSIVFGSIIFGNLLIRKWKSFLIIFITILLLFIGSILFSSQIFQNKINFSIEDIHKLFTDTRNFDYKENTPIKDIKHIEKSVQVLLPNETLNIAYENNNFVFRDSKEQFIQYTKNDKFYTTSNDIFKTISFSFGKFDENSIIIDSLILQVNNQPEFMFRVKEDGSIHLVASNSREYIDIDFPETFGFKGKEKLGSSRGYIWSRSIPLLKDNIILGSGPDTFALIFPQNDLIGKYYALGTSNTIVDKPHSLYLQISLNYGIIALISFLAFMFIYIIDSLKLYAFKKSYEKIQIFGTVNSLGIIGYLFAGIFNDSIISVAPIFWITLGVGVSLNYMNRKSLN